MPPCYERVDEVHAEIDGAKSEKSAHEKLPLTGDPQLVSAKDHPQVGAHHLVWLSPRYWLRPCSGGTSNWQLFFTKDSTPHFLQSLSVKERQASLRSPARARSLGRGPLQRQLAFRWQSTSDWNASLVVSSNSSLSIGALPSSAAETGRRQVDLRFREIGYSSRTDERPVWVES